MTFESDGQTWQVIEDCRDGVIAVLVVDGKRTKRRAYFPYPLPVENPWNRRFLLSFKIGIFISYYAKSLESAAPNVERRQFSRQFARRSGWLGFSNLRVEFCEFVSEDCFGALTADVHQL